LDTMRPSSSTGLHAKGNDEEIQNGVYLSEPT